MGSYTLCLLQYFICIFCGTTDVIAIFLSSLISANVEKVTLINCSPCRCHGMPIAVLATSIIYFSCCNFHRGDFGESNMLMGDDKSNTVPQILIIGIFSGIEDRNEQRCFAISFFRRCVNCI